MLRNLNLNLAGGGRILGTPYSGGVLGSTVPSTGTHGPGAAYSLLSLPAENNVRIRILIDWANLPAGVTSLFVHENTAIEAEGSTGTYQIPITAVYKDDVLLTSGPYAFAVTFGPGLTGTLTTTESEQDVLVASGTPVVIGTFAVTEGEVDSLVTAPPVLDITGTFNVTESEQDTFGASGSPVLIGTFSVIESEQDAFVATGAPVLMGTATMVESADSDTLSTVVPTGSTNPSVAEIWAYRMPNGMTAAEMLMAAYTLASGLEVGTAARVWSTPITGSKPAGSVISAVQDATGRIAGAL